VVAATRPEPAAMSLFELPVARRARLTRVGLVLALDAILAGAGAFLFLAYLDGREAPARELAPAAAPATAAVVDVEPARALASPADLGDAGPRDEAALIGALASVAAAHGAELERCYARAASAAGATLAGALDLRLAVVEGGALAQVSAASNETGSAALAACVVAVVDGWTVPSGAVGEVGWRMRFRPQGAAR
jgi:hypothetical protein